MRRLVGHARVIGAIGQAGDGLPAAKEEVGLPGIPNRPAAGFLRELEQATALAERDNVVDELRLRLDIGLIGVGERGIAPDRRPRGPQLLERFDALVGPGHVKSLSSRGGGDRIPLRVWATISWPDAYPRYRLTLVTVRRTKCRIRRGKSYNMAGVRRKSLVSLRPHVLFASVNASTLICTDVY